MAESSDIMAPVDVADTQAALIAQLEGRVAQQPAPKAEKLPICKASKFDGSRDHQKVKLWLSEVDTMLRAHQCQMPQSMTDIDTLITAEEILHGVSTT